MAEATAPTPSHPDIGPQDVARAEKLFAGARQRGELGQHEYAIALYLQGLAANPEAVEAHQALRQLALQRKLKGGKPMGMIERARLKKGKTPAEQMVHHEHLLAYDPGNLGAMGGLLKAARDGAFDRTVLWVGPILFKRATEDPKPDFNVFIQLKDAFRGVGAFQQALDALAYAKQLKPADSDLEHEFRQMSAEAAMQAGKYGGNFTESIRNRGEQQEQLESDKDIRTAEGMAGRIKSAKAAYEQDPSEGKLLAWVDALLKSEDRDNEERAIEALEAGFRETGNYRLKRRAGEVEIRQMNRMEQMLRKLAEGDPDDEDARRDLDEYVRQRNRRELEILDEQAKQYPNDLAIKYNLGRRHFALGEHDESIPHFQQAQQDPKLKHKARLYLGRAFLESGFSEEAAGTLRELAEDERHKDEAMKEYRYWFGRALEANHEHEEAAATYSKVAQSDFNYRDTRDRLKKVRAAAKPA